MAHRLQVGAFAIDTEASVVPQDHGPQPAIADEILPGDHDIEWAAQFVGRRVQHERVGVTGMIRSQEDAVPTGAGLAHMLQAPDFHAQQAMFVLLQSFSPGRRQCTHQWLSFGDHHRGGLANGCRFIGFSCFAAGY